MMNKVSCHKNKTMGIQRRYISNCKQSKPFLININLGWIKSLIVLTYVYTNCI